MSVADSGMQPVFESLRAEAEREAEEILDEAREESRRILAAAREEVAVRRQAEIAREAVEPRRRAARALASARREGAVQVLQARRRLADHVLRVAGSRFTNGDGLPRETIARLLDEALAYLPPSPLRVTCRPDSAAAVREMAADRADALVEADPALSAGVRVAAADGSVLVDNTLATRIQQRRDELSALVVRTIEGGA